MAAMGERAKIERRTPKPKIFYKLQNDAGGRDIIEHIRQD
jgi:hypothetical protein